MLAALKNCSPRAAVAIKHAIELDEEATRNFVVTNENPTAAACEQFLATLQGGPDEESAQAGAAKPNDDRSEEHTSELQSLMRISYAVFCLKKKKSTHMTQQQ